MESLSDALSLSPAHSGPSSTPTLFLISQFPKKEHFLPHILGGKWARRDPLFIGVRPGLNARIVNWLPSMPVTSGGSGAVARIQAITQWGWASAAVSAAGMGSEIQTITRWGWASVAVSAAGMDSELHVPLTDQTGSLRR